jgi:hypothetical protein
MRWMGLPPPTLAYGLYPSAKQNGPARRVPPGLVSTVLVGRKLPRASLSTGGFVLFCFLFMKYNRVNGFLLGSAYPWQGHDAIRRAP